MLTPSVPKTVDASPKLFHVLFASALIIRFIIPTTILANVSKDFINTMGRIIIVALNLVSNVIIGAVPLAQKTPTLSGMKL